MRACGICNRHLSELGGHADLVRSRSGHFRIAERCSTCTDGDGEASTQALIKTTLGFSSIALLASLLSYLILGFL